MAVRRWTALSDTLPQDNVVDVPGLQGDFLFEWKSTQDIFNVSDKMALYAACTLTGWSDVNYPCRITWTRIWSAYDPYSPDGSAYWAWGAYGKGDCAPNCPEGCMDFLSAAVHEYGHALA
jgi:hypothetical protein